MPHRGYMVTIYLSLEWKGNTRNGKKTGDGVVPPNSKNELANPISKL